MKKRNSIFSKLDVTTISVYICGVLGFITYIVVHFLETPVIL